MQGFRLGGRQRRHFDLLGALSYCTRQDPREEIAYLHEVLQRLDQKSVHPDPATCARLLQTCGKLRALAEGKQLHAHIGATGLEADPVVGVPLLSMYYKCGNVEDARMVFDQLDIKNIVAWTAMIGAYAQTGHCKEALQIFRRMQLEGVQPNDITFTTVLTACASPQALAAGMLIHACIVESGVETKVLVGNALVSMYAKCGSLENARKVFQKMPLRDVVSWTAVIGACAQYEGCEEQVLKLFQQMQLEGLSPNTITLGIVLNACARLEALQQGKLIHSSLVQSGIELSHAIGTALINLYGKCRSLNDARNAFDTMNERNTVSWNALIAVHIQNVSLKKAIHIFHEMKQEGVKQNKVTYITVLNACTSPAVLTGGRSVHASIAESGYETDVIVGNALINMYDTCGSLEDAEQVFCRMNQRNTISWNAMITAYIQHEHGHKAHGLLQKMLLEGVNPNRVTFVTILNSCSSLAQVKLIHGFIVERGDESNAILGSALVNMHGKYGSVEEARKIFDKVEQRDVVSWNGMIAAYAHAGHSRGALELFQQMQQEIHMNPNNITYVTVLEACANLTALEEGKQIHSCISDGQLKSAIDVGIALVNLYGKCGRVKEAKGVFDKLEFHDVVLWTSLIAAYAQHGHWQESLCLVKLMQQEGIEPNHITYVSVLSACSHAGLVEEGNHYFVSMKRDHNITPMREHYRCVIDLLARAGQLDEAESFLKRMPLDPGPVAWMTLLGACRNQGDVERANRAAQLAIKLCPESSAGYVALFNSFVGGKDGAKLEEAEELENIS